ncbi:hypothetical protein MIND_00285700 [Mycena indigotica]|uniref:PARP catalytic domain-containing protein n=1 Tax=Mycena indigotica TaxID=2126181 RepID=A0A8H6T8H0_9AGAR|nr:uncharacterized protein MIND_00285700 [Mycena indigotica]KAF7312709.1 hypothetical protein MIND_00285700 [Mycena indigotica]
MLSITCRGHVIEPASCTLPPPISSFTMPSLLHWGSRQKTPTPVQNDLCDYCGQKPKFIEPGGSRHAYCSRSCAKKAAQGPSPSACALRGCRATGKAAFSDFCSDEHGKQAVALGQAKGCDACHEFPRASGDLCLACDRKFPGVRLKDLASTSAAYNDLRVQFMSEWDGLNAVRPKVDKIFQIVVPRDIRARHDAYRSKQRVPREIRVFHSAQCICDMGTKGPVLCDFKSCGICRVVKSSFNEFAFGEKFNIGRFGEGIYSYHNPSLADAHATSATSTPYRVMIACDASVSVESEVPDEESLFLPSADAIVPAFIIMYSV